MFGDCRDVGGDSVALCISGVYVGWVMDFSDLFAIVGPFRCVVVLFGVRWVVWCLGCVVFAICVGFFISQLCVGKPSLCL